MGVLGAQSLVERLRRVESCPAVKVTPGRTSIFLTGRYLKLSRDIPQSPWFIDGQRKGVSSVEELILNAARRHLGSTEPGAFHAEGREDIYVRMLGGGRPFV